MPIKVEPGMKFGRWTVLQVGVKNPNSKAKNVPNMALCQCECGTIRYKEYRDLYTGRSLSCGCLRSEQLVEKNMSHSTIKVGDTFGLLTVIQDLGLRKQPSRDKRERWSLCKCECGNTIEVRNNNLQSGATKSCGCVKSRGERAIAEILRKNNINFCQQYSFPDLRTEHNGVLRFDFAIFHNDQLYELIEFDGRQHYFGPDGTWTNSDSLETIQFRDQLKSEYCIKNNIKLIRIPYYKIQDISLQMLELDHLCNSNS